MKVSLLLTLVMPLAVAQGDPPGRVARVNLAFGQVSMLSQATGQDWAPAQINFPLTTGDQLWSDFDGRAELQIGTAAIRVHGQTSATFTLLDDRVVQLQLVSGGLNIRVRNLYKDDVFEVDTPNAAFTIRQPGDYRIDVDGPQTKILVWSGAGEIFGDNRDVPLRARDYATVSGYGRLSYTLADAPAPDEFDRWGQDRDRRWDQARQQQSARYYAPDMIGAEDLDLYGSWSEVPNIGPVWSPRVDGGWAPYKVGHWAWIEPWGWTWIDDAPWGFAPFHYGRWAFIGGAWGWTPGPPAQRAVYSPALVAWAGGGGGGFRVSASGGLGLAWFALGPGEVYVPSHRASAEYMTRVNISNTVVNRAVVTNVYNTVIVNKSVVNNVTYVNQRAPGAVVAMSHADMAAGRRTTVAVAPAAFQQVQVTAVAPVPQSRPVMQPVRAASAAPIARPPAAVGTPSRPVVMRNQAPPAAEGRPTFTSATGAPAPTPSRPAPMQQQVQQPVQANPPPPQAVRPGMRESETVRPPRQMPSVVTPGNPGAAQAPVQQPRPQERVVERERPVVTQPQERVTRPEVRVERPAAATPATPPQERVNRPEVRVERPAAATPAPVPQERVNRPEVRVERPATVTPAPVPQERVTRPEVRVERPTTVTPAPVPQERVTRPEVRVERPATVTPTPAPARPEVRPEVRREDPKRVEKKEDRRPEKKDEKKEEKKQ